MIDSRPLDSLVLTMGLGRVQPQMRMWDEQALKTETKWQDRVKVAKRLIFEEHQLSIICDEYKEKYKEAQTNYELHKAKYEQKKGEREQEDLNVQNHFIRGVLSTAGSS